MRHANKLLGAIMVAALMLLYPAAYRVLVTPGPAEMVDGSGTMEHLAEYRCGGRLAELLFIPAHELDKRLRPGIWRYHVEIY